MNAAETTQQSPEVGLAKEHVSTLIGKPYAHPQQRRAYEANRRRAAQIVRRHLTEIEGQIAKLPIVQEAENLWRWLRREEARQQGSGVNGNGGR